MAFFKKKENGQDYISASESRKFRVKTGASPTESKAAQSQACSAEEYTPPSAILKVRKLTTCNFLYEISARSSGTTADI
jgi:hypothetical protein